MDLRSTSQTSKPSRPREGDIHTELGSQSRIIQELFDRVKSLDEHLEPVLRRSTEIQSKDEKQPSPTRSAIADCIVSHNERLLTILQLLNRLDTDVQV